ncbi:MAG TPA: hypothetical protein VGR76_22825 [Candidatus Angelobacter sp.]|jgi:hypothetical protein|nr:hypothetical protein [Candidatus Angelobacter sp.]
MFDIIDRISGAHDATHKSIHKWCGVMLQMPAFWLIVRLDTAKCLPVLLKVKSK